MANCHQVTENDRTVHIYSNFEAAGKFHKADHPLLFHTFGLPYPASYDEYSVVFVSFHHCAKSKI
jgi:hypothetical protein